MRWEEVFRIKNHLPGFSLDQITKDVANQLEALILTKSVLSFRLHLAIAYAYLDMLKRNFY